MLSFCRKLDMQRRSIAEDNDAWTDVQWREQKIMKKKDSKSFLFSLNLNKKFYEKQGYSFISTCDDSYGLRFGNNELVLFYCKTDEFYSKIGKKNSNYNNNGITTEEFCLYKGQ